MKITRENLEFSGKGAVVSSEFLHDNIKIKAEQTELHELVVVNDDQSTRVGWLVPNSFELLADFTTHSDDGARGKSTHDYVEQAVLFDPHNYLSEFIPETMVDVDTTTSKEILDKMLADDKLFNGEINLDSNDHDHGLVIISPHSNLVFVQTDNSSIRVAAPDGVYVLKRGEGRDKLIIIDHDEGINIWGDKNISINSGRFIIDGKPLNIQKIINQAMSSVSMGLAGLSGLAGLGALGSLGNFDFDFDFDDAFDFDFDFDENFIDMSHVDMKMKHFEKKMEKFGKKMEKMGEKMARSFGKNFSKNFIIFDDDDDFDTDFSDAYDVDVDF